MGIKILVFLSLLSLTIYSQSPKDNVLGHYVGLERQTNTNTNSFWDCSGAIYNVKATPFNYPEIRIEDTSCTYIGGVAGSFIVLDDSTIREYWGQTYIYGKLHPNDSLYFKWWYACCQETKVEFFGFKQYGFPAPVGINELGDLASDITLYPQPANETLYIQSTTILFNQKRKAQLYDTKGRKIDCIFDYINTHTFKVDVSAIAAGVYVLEIETNEGVLRKKFVISK